MGYRRDTIVALSTPAGQGGIAVIRLSGPDSLPLARLLVPSLDRGGVQSHRAIHGVVVDPDRGDRIDDVLILPMLAPRSYTGEDTVEIHCHGGPLITRSIISLLCSLGARSSEPGEFTRRAFLNGRMDLLQAEGVIDLITARSELSLRVASREESGVLSSLLRELTDQLRDILSLVEALIDFPEDEPDSLSLDHVTSSLTHFLDRADRLIADSRRLVTIQNGVRIVIVGRPNVGKSSLLNMLLGRDRAIVTEIPGTTRDTIEEEVLFGDLPVHLVDTAGFRDTTDPVELLGIDRTRSALDSSDLVLFLLDGSTPLTEDDRRLWSLVSGLPTLVLLTKSDLPRILDPTPLIGSAPLLPISSRTGEGGDLLISRVQEMVVGGDVSDLRSLVAMSHVHQIDSLSRCRHAVHRAFDQIHAHAPLECVAADLRDALSHLGEITGETTPDQLLDRIFSRFCIGK